MNIYRIGIHIIILISSAGAFTAPASKRPPHSPCRALISNSLGEGVQHSAAAAVSQKIPSEVAGQLRSMNARLPGSRPDFEDRPAYESWLMEQQRRGADADAPYGYYIVKRGVDFNTEALSYPYAYFSLKRGPDKGRSYTIQPREIPAWMDHVKFNQNDPQTWQEYTSWAESYYQRTGFYPPEYLSQIKKLRLRYFNSKKTPVFQDSRRLQDVQYAFGKTENGGSRLLHFLDSLTGRDKWLDGGSGEGLILENALLRMHQRGEDQIPEVTGVTYQSGRSGKILLNMPQAVLEKYTLLEGRFFQEIPDAELLSKGRSKIRLITDFLGVFSYSSDPAEVVNRYVNLMDSGGVLGLVYSDIGVVRTGRQDKPFHEWLKHAAPDLEIEKGFSYIGRPRRTQTQGSSRVSYMLIRNPSGQTLQLPSLESSLEIWKEQDRWTSRFVLRQRSDIAGY